ncbi:phosphoribosylaminoimidazolesuccinocarboxamide synthase [Eubacteriales bacterium OttesenSCG-928-N14]|nr:phosphoribosylaminoimidazolesuccinocarboxamide synthase [Eubacteriales bacterium OttesenSCG-928-N14]
MQHVYEGKTKSVYQMEDGNYLLRFKDDVTGTDGVFDPGANAVGAHIEGMGKAGLTMSKHFFELINAKGIPTHFISADLDKVEMVVKQGKVFGQGVEVVCRLRAVGSFFRRYERYATLGQPLDYLVEVTLKDDDRDDPLINADALNQLNIMTHQEYEQLSELTKKITRIVADEIAAKGAELYDIKFEFGRDANGQIMLIDEISAGNMRAYRDGKVMDPLDLAALFM